MFPGYKTRTCAGCNTVEEEEIAPLPHTEVHVEAKEATCYEDGNVEYYYCSVCGAHWLPNGMPTNRFNVIVLGGHDVVAMDAVEPGCHYIGNIAYWFCTKCDTVWADEALTQITNHKNVILPELGGEVEHVAAAAPTCETEGNVEYWHCANCDQYWLDEARTQLTNRLSTLLGVLEHNKVHVDGVEPGCHYTGVVEHEYCADCGARLSYSCSQYRISWNRFWRRIPSR